ncbi:MAG: P-loop NTPase [Sandaracinaceae bacterium]
MSQPIIISVGGGKGGVGKSVVAANLALATAELGMSTVLVDADFGAANQHTLFGIDRPHATLQSLLRKDVESIEAIAMPTGQSRLFLVPGVGAVPGAANMSHAQKLKVIRHIKRIDAEVVVIDVGAGVSFNVLDFTSLGDLRLIVSSPQLTAMQNAYCFLKAAVHRLLRDRAITHAQRELYANVTSDRETDRVAELRRRIAKEDPAFARSLEQVLRGFGGYLVGNMLEGPHQRKVLQALTRMAQDFLEIELPLVSTLAMSRAIHESVTRRRPILAAHPSHALSSGIRQLAEQLLSVDVEAIRRLRTEASPALPDRVSDEELLGVTLIDYLRADERVRVDHAARVSVGSTTTIRGRVRDLSYSGALVEAPIDAAEGDHIRITMVGFEDRPALRGIIRHVAVSGAYCGVELDETSQAIARDLLESGVRESSTLPPPLEVATG